MSMKLDDILRKQRAEHLHFAKRTYKDPDLRPADEKWARVYGHMDQAKALFHDHFNHGRRWAHRSGLGNRVGISVPRSIASEDWFEAELGRFHQLVTATDPEFSPDARFTMGWKVWNKRTGKPLAKPKVWINTPS